jgi:uncharacterized damage-inducible protein DinB
MPESLVQLLITHFESVFAGPNGDYPAVLESVEGIEAAQAIWKPAADRNSIWQIVEHLTASMLWQLEVLERGQARVAPWIEPAGGEREWQASLQRLREAHARLNSALGRLTEKDLLNIPPKEQQTQLVLLLSTAAHEAHHSGQIDYLKGLQGASAQ